MPLQTFEIGDFYFHIFTKASSAELFEKHLELKYETFVDELGWKSLPHLAARKIVREDEYDSYSMFGVIETRDRIPVGTVRGTKPETLEHFPHRDVYNRYLKADELIPLRHNIAVVNSLSAIPAFRGVTITGSKGLSRLSISEILGILLLESLRHSGTLIVFASADPDNAGKLCAHLGFRVLDTPYLYDDASGTVVIDMALIINERLQCLVEAIPEYTPKASFDLSDHEKAARAYFSARESSLVGEDWCQRFVRIRRTRFPD